MSLLRVRGLTARYGDFQALFGVDLDVGPGECVAVIGANGAGKTTLMRAVAGVLPSAPDAVTFDGAPIGDRPAHEVMAMGVAMVPEGRRLFPSLSVEENLLVGAHGRRAAGPWSLGAVYDLFPALRERRRAPGTALSGGQQQMVAIGRALMSNPRLLLCDEISLGLAPVVIRDIYAALPRIRETAAVVLVEQDIGQALRVADRVHCMMEGRVTLSGRPSELTREAIHDAYFGTAGGSGSGAGTPDPSVGGPARAGSGGAPGGDGGTDPERRDGAGAQTLTVGGSETAGGPARAGSKGASVGGTGADSGRRDGAGAPLPSAGDADAGGGPRPGRDAPLGSEGRPGAVALASEGGAGRAAPAGPDGDGAARANGRARA